MTEKQRNILLWEEPFLAALARWGNIGRAAKAAGITKSPAYRIRKRDPEFARRWDAALRDAGAAKCRAAKQGEVLPMAYHWERDFMQALAETSNVSAAAARAMVSTREVYDERRRNSAFAAKWRAALYEGYCNLEMEVLGYLRDPAPKRKMDVANALRLLAAHKESIAKEGAQRANVSAAEVRASIERRVQKLREQIAARREREAG
ncbi:MAG: hypothetical protein COW16_08485 [Sphingomonadales bacterium CG12_big_fil_rev_8_21_14_0_65_65_10]|nr:MAG: hypothetical protein COW16_08485 [Sphingomonadales bacterium CG12_big_fil_rev_8_21_14_0_65_65_10]